MSKLSEEIKSISNMTAEIKFDGEKCKSDLTKFLQDTTEVWLENNLSHYISTKINYKNTETTKND